MENSSGQWPVASGRMEVVDTHAKEGDFGVELVNFFELRQLPLGIFALKNWVSIFLTYS